VLEHGGALLAAARRYGIAPEEWLDLSTGVNPRGWPVPGLPREAWRALPQEEDGLARAAAEYYGSPLPLPVAGSQAAIQALPALRAPCRVGIPALSYGEHARAWARHGHRVTHLAPEGLGQAAGECEVLVVCNPDNPSGRRIPAATLLNWRERLARRGGWLVVDEAFADADPGDSLARHTGEPGVVVLRSLGKFFGLAGARVGFALAWPELLRRLEKQLGPWAVNGPGRWVALAALRDEIWQAAARARLRADSRRLAALLQAHGLAPAGATDLFQWVVTGEAAALHESLARQAILTRPFAQPASLRFGLPGQEADWHRLERTLIKHAKRHRPSPPRGES
jgi:cobalamin biosynthetic protein CobC